MGLFKKKAGGTLVGNILRGISSRVAPGILGTGKELIPLEPNQQATNANQTFERAANALEKGPKIRAAVPIGTILGFGGLIVLAALLFRPSSRKRK